MRAISKSTNIPATLLPVNTAYKNNVLEEKIQKGQELTSKDFDSSIYGADDVREQLKLDQFGKCAYCESDILAINGGEVEHYRPKTAYIESITSRHRCRPAYYRLAYDWTNLLAVCTTCNKNKGSYFPLMNSNQRDITGANINQEIPLIINPCFTNPDVHLEYRTFILYPKRNSNGNEDIFGRATIDYLKLNREDLKELRRRNWMLFYQEMIDNKISYDECLERISERMRKIESSIEYVDYVNMYYNQTFRNNVTT